MASLLNFELFYMTECRSIKKFIGEYIPDNNINRGGLRGLGNT